MADACFEDPRLAALHDRLEGARPDLAAYLAMAGEFGAARILDIGCGTGTLACLLAERGAQVVAVDPAAASLEVARRKPHAERVRWLLGDALSALPVPAVDLVTMTGNVAQVFLGDEEWDALLRAVRAVLVPGGRLVFETRDPSRRAWQHWTRPGTHRVLELPDEGRVEAWTDLLEVRPPLVSFRQHIRIGADPVPLTSDSTLRFRTHEEVERSLTGAGLVLDDVRDAPDRPGLELVFVARRPT